MSKMENWNTNKLKDLGSITANGVNKKIDSSEIPVSLVNYMDVYSYNKIDNNFEFQQVTANQRQIQNCNLLKGDVLFTPTSETPDDIGNSAVIIEHLINAVYSYHIVRFRQNDDIEFDKDFLAYLFNQYDVLKYFTSRATGITRFTLNRSDFQNLTITYPDPPEQRAIASVLSKVDDAIAATKETIAKAERLKIVLMQNLLTGNLKPDGTRRSEDEFYIDEKFGKVPKGWEVKKVKEICDRRNESFEPSQSDENLDYIGLEHIISDKFRINGFGKSNDTKSTKSEFYPGDLLYGKLRPYLNKIWKAQFNGVCSTDIVVLESELYTDWLYFNLQTVTFLNYTQSMTAGTQHPRARWKDIGRFQIILPIDENEKIEIENSLKSLETVYDDNTNKIKKLERLKKALMQNLLTGKKRLKAEYIQGFSNG